MLFSRALCGIPRAAKWTKLDKGKLIVFSGNKLNACTDCVIYPGEQKLVIALVTLCQCNKVIGVVAHYMRISFY